MFCCYNNIIPTVHDGAILPILGSNHTFNTYIPTPSGVPKRGRLLFALFINSLNTHLSYSRVLLFVEPILNSKLILCNYTNDQYLYTTD